MKNMLISLLLSFSVSIAAGEWPSQSLYQVDSQWQDSSGKTAPFADADKSVRIVAFVYTHCISMCPVIVADLKRIEAKLSAEMLQKTRFTLISLDPENDTPSVMAEFLRAQKLDSERWQFLRSNDQDTRELALLFKIRYRQEGDEIAHSNVISLLDKEGVLQHQRLGTGGLEQLIAKANEIAK